VTTALYRRYRPETFAEVIGQDHVTAPLMQALRSGRVSHAYLFSGPRGCGKTTSARILARTLNCAQNTPESPIDMPCGVCPSCVDLARGGPGSLDVVEIDAASHGGVDDARDLRERATFAPTRDRFKIFIIDEAHMVSPAGFNALLKTVEEPPEHVKFVFATTEPDKVIGTIRSRTHHYPFRLVPPDVLGPYLEELCAAEGVAVGSGVHPLVTRAGGGSVRDSLSVMDQLIAGAENGTVDYERAVALLGYTHSTLLDDVVDALAARDGASIFRVVDHVIATGHEPRRFVEDVLERLRDLIVIGVSGDAAEAVLRDQPADQLARMRTQAQNLGVSELSRAADLVNAALTEMTGATSPRLHLELLVARLLLPGSDDGAAGFAARLDRLERGGLGAAPGGVVPAAPGPVATAPSVPDVASPPPAAPVASSGLTGPAAVRAALRPGRGATPAAERTDAPPAAPQESADATASVAASESEPAPASGDGGRTPSPETPASESAPAPEAPEEPTAHDLAEHAVADEPTVDTAERDTAVHDPAEHDTAEHDTVEHDAAGRDTAADEPTTVAAAAPAPAAPASAEPAPAAPAPSPGGAAPAMTTEELRRRWPEVLETLRASRVTWSLVSTNAQVAELGPDVLHLAFPSSGLARTFSSSRHTGAVQDAVYQTLGLQVRVEARLAEEGPGGHGGGGPSGPASPAPGGGTSQASDVAGEPARPGASSLSASVSVPASATATGSAVGPPRGSVAVGPRAVGTAPVVAAPSGGVALQERPEAPAAPSAVVDAADEAWLAGTPVADAPARPAVALAEPAPPAPARPGPSAPPTVDAADEAWLAGAPLSEPPADLDDGPEPEPVLEPQRADVPRPGATQPETPRQAAERREAERRQAALRAPSRPAVPAPADPAEDDLPSRDDPDIVSTGLVGAQLVVKLLDGKVLEEIQQQDA
jgi:DNA polymerase III subunit gamma/tau